MAREPDSLPPVHPAKGQHTQILVAEVGGDLHSAVERGKEGNTCAHTGSSARCWVPVHELCSSQLNAAASRLPQAFKINFLLVSFSLNISAYLILPITFVK